jgi:acyl carrier protein
MHIKSLPLDLNGKVDRKALTSFVLNDRHKTLSITREQDQNQNEMISLWSSLLSIPRDTIEEDSSFFSLGGDSLGALKLVKAINEQYGVSLRLSEVIADPATPSSMLVTVNSYRAEK